jgi:hypothetical protein
MGRTGDGETELRGAASPRHRFSPSLPLHFLTHALEAMKGLEPLSTGLQDRRLIQLSYIAVEFK